MKKYVLAPYVQMGYGEKGLYVGFGSIKQIITKQERINIILKTAKYWMERHDIYEIKNFSL